MNKLPFDKQATILSLLVEGTSIRSAERITGVTSKAIRKLLVHAGQKAEVILDSELRNINSRFIEVDEIWTYVQKKQKNCTLREKMSGEVGDQYVYVALDAESKLVHSFLLGKRTSECAVRFMRDLNSRLSEGTRSRFQLTTDSFNAYTTAVYLAFDNVDYAQVHKTYGKEDKRDQKRYSPADLIYITVNPVFGEPDPRRISTSFVERQNLTMRMQMRRFTRLTNAFSKKKENLQAALSLHFYHYNFMRIHKTLRMTPAMKANVTKSIWGWDDLLFREERTYRIAA
jgi:IS1 family transposase